MDPYSILEDNYDDSGNISFESINWIELREFDAKKAWSNLLDLANRL